LFIGGNARNHPRWSPDCREVAIEFDIDFELEEDGRWIAEIESLPGVLAYGSTQEEARLKARELVRQVVLERATRE
jgi:predicted RNase H-like HicB family nuclease